MTHATTTIYVPCEVFHVEAVVGPSDVLSPIERLALRMVDQGAETVGHLEALIGLGSRPTLDLMHGLWQRGYLIPDPETSQLVITDAVREAIRTNTLDQLPGGELSTVSVPLMQDLVGGAVLSAEPIRFTPPRARTAPPILPAGGFRRASPTSFRLPVARAIRKMEAFRSRPLEVFQASLPLGPHAGEAVAGARAFLRIEVACSLDPDSDRLDVQIVFPAWLPRGTQSVLAAGLVTVSERFPDHEVVRTLRAAARVAQAPVPTQAVLLSEAMLALTQGMDDIDAKDRLDLHTELVELSESAVALLGTDADTAQQLEPLVGADDIDDAISRVVEVATLQLVLVCPWIRPQGFHRWYQRLKKRLAEQPDLRVLVIWGIGPASQIPSEGPIVDWLADLRGTGRFFLSERPANTHAKLAIADATHAVISSFNFLAATPGRVVEIGVAARATPPWPSPLALELLRAALEMCPEHAMTLMLMTEPEQWRLQRPSEAAVDFAIPEMPSTEDEDDDPEDDWTINARWQIWRQEWQTHAHVLADALRRRARPASLVRDGDHQRLMWNAIREAKVRLIIGSDQVRQEVVTPRLLDAITGGPTERSLALVYTRVPEAVHEALAARLGDRALRCSGDTVNHAKFVWSDDQVLVSSFNFLSFDGDYDGDARYGMRMEVGVLLRDANVVASLGEKLGRMVPAIAPLVDGVAAADVRGTASRTPTRLDGADADHLRDLLRVLARPGGDEGRAGALRAWVRGGKPWSGLRLMRDLAHGELPRLVVLALREHLGDEGEDRRAWLTWWAENGWHERLPQASAIRTAVALEELGIDAWLPRLPPAGVARLQWEVTFGDPLPEAFDEEVLAQLDTPVPAHTNGLLALGLQLLMRGVPVEESCDVIAASAQAPLPAWLDLVKRFRVATWQQAVPMEVVRARAGSHERHRRAEDARVSALQKINDAGQEGMWDFMKGRTTRPYLFDVDRPVGRLAAALADADVASVTKWVREHRDLDALLDRATAEGLAALLPELAGEEIVEPRRSSCLRRLRGVRAAAQAWLETEPQQEGGELWHPTLELARGLCAERKAFGELVAASHARRAAEDPILGALAELVAPLLTIGEQ